MEEDKGKLHEGRSYLKKGVCIEGDLMKLHLWLSLALDF